MKYYNCENAAFVKDLYDEETVNFFTNQLSAFHTEIQTEAHICYLGKMQKRNAIFHSILLLLPCSDGKIRPHIDNWNECKQKFRFRSGLMCKKIYGNEQICQALCNYVVSNKMTPNEVDAYIKSLAKQSKNGSLQI